MKKESIRRGHARGRGGAPEVVAVNADGRATTGILAFGARGSERLKKWGSASQQAVTSAAGMAWAG